MGVTRRCEDKSLQAAEAATLRNLILQPRNQAMLLCWCHGPLYMLLQLIAVLHGAHAEVGLLKRLH